MKAPILSLFLLLMIGCSHKGWVYYQDGLQCHMSDKGSECNQQYEKAIQEKHDIQGLHASYGTHLLILGQTEKSQKHFAIEKELFPEATPVLGLLAGKKASESTKTVRTDTKNDKDQVTVGEDPGISENMGVEQ